MKSLLAFAVFACVSFGQNAASNLGFEEGQPGETPPGWFVPQALKNAGYKASLTSEGCYKGNCVAITVPETQPERMFGNIMNSIDATPYRGKRIVFRAAVRAEKGTAMMWVRIDKGPGVMGFFDNMQDRPIQPGEWKFYEIRGTVDADATRVNYGVMAHGDARVLVDEASLDFSDVAISVDVPEGLRKQYAAIDQAYASRKFALLKNIATEDAQFGSVVMKMRLQDAIAELESQYGGASELKYATTIESAEITDSDARVRTTSRLTLTQEGIQVAYIATGSDTWKLVDGVWRLREGLITGMRELQEPDTPETVRTVSGEIRKHAVRLTGVEAGKPYDDLAAFGKAVGDARVVALGEATHGTREIFQAKHRLLEYLVREKGFTVFAIEANWPESQAADRYVKTGEGDPKAALKDMYFWTWQTEEVLAMLEWMREFNKAPGKHPILSFTSFDMQTYGVARAKVLAFVKQNASAPAAEVEAAYAPLAKLQARSMSDPGFGEAADRAESVVSLLEKNREALVTATSADAYREAVQMARIVAQAARMRTPGSGSSYRDQMMARNIEWLLKEAFPGQKIVLWAHNGHVMTSKQPGFRPMGSWLREALRDEMYVVGFAINKGTVRAFTREGGNSVGLVESPVPPAGAGTGTATLSAAGVPLFFLDLRSLSGPLAKWANSPHLFRSCGAMWDRSAPENFMRSEQLSKSYDGLIYLEQTNAARGLQPGPTK